MTGKLLDANQRELFCPPLFGIMDKEHELVFLNMQYFCGMRGNHPQWIRQAKIAHKQPKIKTNTQLINLKGKLNDSQRKTLEQLSALHKRAANQQKNGDKKNIFKHYVWYLGKTNLGAISPPAYLTCGRAKPIIANNK